MAAETVTRPVRADRPIIFSGPMVQALLAGRKTQTRRILKRDLQSNPYLSASYGDRTVQRWEGGVCVENTRTPGHPRSEMVLPYVGFATGDRLWVREAAHRAPDLWVYSADGSEMQWPARQALAGRLRDTSPSIHLSRIASRLTLIVESVRVERLNDISEADAAAEGIERSREFADRYLTPAGDYAVPVVAFQRLWNSLHGPNAWAANPWVVAIGFRVIRANIDALPAELGSLPPSTAQAGGGR